MKYCFCGIFYFTFILPLSCFAQVTISGRILNQADTKPLANASVFVNNTTIGVKTANDGTFSLHNITPGKYELVVSIIGFETYSQVVEVADKNIALPDILVFPKTTVLNEVKVTVVTDPDRQKNYDLFKNEFLGTSDRAKMCVITNPEVLDLAYNDTTGVLTASSVDFLEIKNEALGYRVKYLLKNFTLTNLDVTEKKIYYQGAVLYEELKGKPSQERHWQTNRQQVYENSPMHFLRAPLNDRLTEEGFRVQQYANYRNPDRPADNIIDKQIALYKELKSPTGQQRDSLAYWVKKSKLPKTLQKLYPFPLSKQDIIQTTGKPGQYALNCDFDALYVAYSKTHHYHINDQVDYLYNANNTENTLITFNDPEAYFNNNGVITNPFSVQFKGVWGRNRIAELLPVDYEPPQSEVTITGNDFEQTIETKLQKYLREHPTEKAYLQLDKPFYAAGDTIYFKAYITKGEQHQLSNLSGLLHVDLINTHNNIDQSLKLKLDSGLTWGDFALPDSLPAGNYRVRAYTQWMRNDGETGFFDKVVPVGSSKPIPVPESLAKQTQQPALNPDVQFFPEGGSLVTGINSKIAFKAIDPNGLGIDCKGTIVDNDNKTITSFTSAHLGMGYFYLTPQEGKTYTANIVYTDKQTATFNLPAAEKTGISLSLKNDSLPQASVQITADAEYYRNNRNKNYSLVIYSKGLASSIGFKLDKPEIKLDILKRKLRTGIATVTLFSPTNEPLCERPFFVQNYDQLTLNISSSKNKYSKREHVNLMLSALNRKGEVTEGHFSVAVTDETKLPDDKNAADNILTDLLLTSDLKGYVEQPSYYFNDTSTTARNRLDVLLLTQGYRRFAWKQVLDTTTQSLAWQPEKGLTISGKVESLGNKPVANGTVTLIPPKGGQLYTAVTDQNGIFHFTGLAFPDTAHFVLSAVNANGKNLTKITYFNDATDKPNAMTEAQLLPPNTLDSTISVLVKNDRLQQLELLNNGKGKGIMLKQVNIKEKKPEDQYQTQNLAGAGHADQVLHSNEIGHGTIVDALNGRLRGVTFDSKIGNVTPYLTLSFMAAINDKNPPKPMLVIVDGRQLNAYGAKPDISTINPSDIETVEVLKYAGASIYGVEGAGGVLIITTKTGNGINPKDIASVGILPIAPGGFYKAREFYSPKYNTSLVNKQHDYRSTIYWNPEIKTGKNGNSSFDYYNADGTGTYKVTIEGIDKDGNIGRQLYRYKVE